MTTSTAAPRKRDLLLLWRKDKTATPSPPDRLAPAPSVYLRMAHVNGKFSKLAMYCCLLKLVLEFCVCHNHALMKTKRWILDLVSSMVIVSLSQTLAIRFFSVTIMIFV